MMDEYFMNIALEEAYKAYNKGEVPVGAVLVFDNKIVAKGYNLRETKNDITMHAELIAIKKASKKIKDWRLDKMTLYVTLLPCPMCASAIVQSRIKKIVVGTTTLDKRCENIVLSILEGNNTSPRVEIKYNVLNFDCKKLLQKFFKERRNNVN